MKLNYHVTFENSAGRPTSVRGTIEGSNVGTCIRRAVVDAKKQAKHVHWDSIVVLVEKMEKPE